MKKFFVFGTLALLATGVFAAPSTSGGAIDAARPLFEKGDYAGAQKLTEEALSLAKTPGEQMDALLHLGLIYDKRKLPAQARQQWRKILEVPGASAKDKAGVHSLLGASYGEEGNWVYARTEFQKALDAPETTAQERAGISLQIAETFVGEKNTVEAEKRFLALAQDTTLDANFRAMVYSMLGEVQAGAHEFESARNAFNQTLSFPDVPGELRIAAHAGIARSYKAQGDAAQAQAEFSKAQVESFIQGQLCSERKQYSQARTFFEQGLTFGNVAPTLDVGMRVQIAYVLLAEGKPGEARTRLEEVVAKGYGPGLSAQDEATVLMVKQSAQLSIAKSFVQEGNKAQAQKVLQTLLATENLNPVVQNVARTLLKGLS